MALQGLTELPEKKNKSLCTPEGISSLFFFSSITARLICSYVNLTKQTERTSREAISEWGEEVTKNTKWWFIKWCDYLCKGFHPPHPSTHRSSNRFFLWTSSSYKICIGIRGNVYLINCHQAETKRKSLLYQNMLKIKMMPQQSVCVKDLSFCAELSWILVCFFCLTAFTVLLNSQTTAPRPQANDVHFRQTPSPAHSD